MFHHGDDPETYRTYARALKATAHTLARERWQVTSR
jgi:hypothetical protein